MAALAAHERGARVLLIEKNSVWGGTSAKSGFHIWIPNNRHMRAQGYQDPKTDCLRYMAEQSYPQLFDPASNTLGLPLRLYQLLDTFYEQASPTLNAIADWDVLNFAIARLGMQQIAAVDYNDNSPYNKAIVGRSLMPINSEGSMEMGRYAAEQFRRAIEKRRIPIQMATSAKQLHLNDRGEVIGVAAQNSSGQTINIRARRAVVFGTGCYTANPSMLQQYQMVPTMGGCGAPSNTGDFIRIAGSAGAQLGNLSGAWRAQIVLEDSVNYRSTPAAVFWPIGDSMFIVNKYGKRCVNEKRNYNDRTRALMNYDANRCEYPNLVTFMIYDQRCAEIYGGSYPLPPEPTASDYVIRGDTLEGLSAAIRNRLKKYSAHVGNVQLAEQFNENLQQSFVRFNAMARKGVDEDFQRGEFAYDKAWHNMQARPPHPRWPQQHPQSNSTMYPLQATGPYYAIILLPGCLGTNGGPLINHQAQILGYDEQPIAGLYGAGNCIASPAGNAYWGGGTTIGTALTFGRIAGERAAAEQEKAS